LLGVAAVVERQRRHQHRTATEVIVDEGDSLPVVGIGHADQQARTLRREARAETGVGYRRRRRELRRRIQRGAVARIDPDPTARPGAAQRVVGRGHGEARAIQQQVGAEVCRRIRRRRCKLRRRQP
jgi:hypothetical protein